MKNLILTLLTIAALTACNDNLPEPQHSQSQADSGYAHIEYHWGERHGACTEVPESYYGYMQVFALEPSKRISWSGYEWNSPIDTVIKLAPGSYELIYEKRATNNNTKCDWKFGLSKKFTIQPGQTLKIDLKVN